MGLRKIRLTKNLAVDVVKDGKHIKIVSCSFPMMIRVMSKRGELIIETEVRGGFELALDESFSKVVVTSEQSQGAEIWVSKIALGYTAPTSGANSNVSAMFEHYGDIEQLAPFEASRTRMTVVSDSVPFWYGGDGLTIENGIKAEVGEKVTIDGAGEFNVAIDLSGAYSLAFDSAVVDGSTAGAYKIIKTTYGVVFASKGTYKDMYFQDLSGAFTKLTYGSDTRFTGAEMLDDGETLMAATTTGGFRFFNLVTGAVTGGWSGNGIPSEMINLNGRIWCKYGGNGNQYFMAADGSMDVILDNRGIGNFSTGAIFVVGAEVWIMQGSGSKLYSFPLNDIPAVLDETLLTVISASSSGTGAYAMVTENADVWCWSNACVNTRAITVDKVTKVVSVSPYCNRAIAVSDGILVFDKNDVKEYSNDFLSYTEYEVDKNISSTWLTWPYFLGNRFFMYVDGNVIERTTIKKRSVPLAKFRLLKSSI